jgi:hypothetical protein
VFLLAAERVFHGWRARHEVVSEECVIADDETESVAIGLLRLERDEFLAEYRLRSRAGAEAFTFITQCRRGLHQNRRQDNADPSQYVASNHDLESHR